MLFLVSAGSAIVQLFVVPNSELLLAVPFQTTIFFAVPEPVSALHVDSNAITLPSPSMVGVPFSQPAGVLVSVRNVLVLRS